MNSVNYGFYKVAVANFPIAIGDISRNLENISSKIDDALRLGVQLLVFPELSLTGYTCGDLFLRKDICDKSLEALLILKARTENNHMLICVGMPIMNRGKVYDCAVYLQSGKVLGVVPKASLTAEEKRWFTPACDKHVDNIILFEQYVPFTESLLLDGGNGIIIGTEIGETLWSEAPISGLLSRAGATIIVNPSASYDIIGKRDLRKQLVAVQSGRCRSAYIYASSGAGESTTDLVFSGHCMIAENGKITAEEKDIMSNDTLLISCVDIERCGNDRRRYSSDISSSIPDVLDVPFYVYECDRPLPDSVDAHPFVPDDVDERRRRCEEVLSLQARGLIQRLKSINVQHVVIGVSGGLDSTLALLAACKAFDTLNLPRTNIHAITMPGFGTTKMTKTLADSLMEELGVSTMEVDIKNVCTTHLRDIGHQDGVYDSVYENAQARERTQILFDVANMVNGIVVGTGDLSELVLGWCTYNGDHMSNYAVNAGVPKTLVKHIVWVYAVGVAVAGSQLQKTLLEIVNIPVSPELLPVGENGEMVQKTEESIGKYDLHDFFIYHYLRNGFCKEKIELLARIAFPSVSEKEIKETLNTFYARFRTQQFKRSCVPDGVKIGSVGLSPRGDLQLPSDIVNLY